MFGLGLPEIAVIGVIALVLFGPRRLPEMGQALGKSIKEFKKAMDDVHDKIDAKEEPHDTKEPRNPVSQN